MPVRLRLQRHGKKNRPFYHIVVADSRAPRDGRFIAKLGTYNPITDPATIDLDLDAAVDWLAKGAQPSDTVRAILSYKGVLLKRHLQRGVTKGAFSQEEADKRFEAWLGEKSGKIQAKKERISREKSEAFKSRLKDETAKKEAIAQTLAKKRADALAAITAKPDDSSSDDAAAAE